jgi:serine/threonine protein kinase
MPSIPFPAPTLATVFPSLSGFDFIKSGTFKSVYRVTTSSGSTEVLKIIRLPQDTGSEASRILRSQELGRAKREITLLGKIASSFVVKLGTLAPTVIDISGEECVAYTEELLPGRDLESVIADKIQPSESEVRSLLSCLVQAIQSLWSQEKVVHRDIKPANLFATGLADRPFVLLDFGIAYNVDEPGLTANPAMIPATPLYMAPEMLDPNFRETLSYRADLYAAGVTAFEYASGGTHPLAKTGDQLVKTLTRILHQEPLRLASLRPDLPSSLLSLIDQLMKKSPSLRPGNLSLILKQLQS